MKIGIGQINVIVGDLEGNKGIILGAYEELCNKGAEIVMFPELALVGYSPRDLIFRDHFVRDNEKALDEIAQKSGKVPMLVGFVECDWGSEAKHRYNAVAWCENGEVKHIARKTLLPSYNVFDEKRYFHPGEGPLIVNWKGKKIGLTICEDIWTGKDRKSFRIDNADPVKAMAEVGVDLVLNFSASPWDFRKWRMREEVVREVVKACESPIVYVNHYGGHDELVFDGRSLVMNKEGEVIARCRAFKEDLRVVDLEHVGEIDGEMSEIEEIYEGVLLGLGDYVRKVGFKKALVGLSGGIDSAVVCALAVAALGKEAVMGFGLPSAISSEHSIEDARKLAENLGIKFEVLGIQPIVDATEKVLEPLFKGMTRDVTEENIQARARGVLLMAISNKLNGILLTTGNKSEMAVGYCTLYGDMAGGLAVISDIVKTKVYELARYINRDGEVIPWNTINKEPSAELSPNQKDSDSLPPYSVLDPIVCQYIEEHRSRKDIIKMGFDADVVNAIILKIDRNEYKRKQAPPGLKITTNAFGIGRRMPIVQKYYN